jgi:NAD(P)-dependent dehydrogenase (short-subunit alcohol dehydrogenase family)
MDIAIVTGAETPLGLRLVKDLIRQGCRVHGIGNNFSKVTYADPHFIAHAIDLSDLEAVTRTAAEILEKEQQLHILIHAIDVTPGAPFEKLPVGNLDAILKVGLLGPVMLTRLALPNLLRFRGQLINIIPANKSGCPASAVNALIEGGLREMNNALFDQARDAGLRVTNLILRQNTVTDLDAGADKQHQARIDPEHVARTVERLLDENDPNVPSEITLYPRLSANAETALPETALPIDPYNAVVLPPAKYCPPEQEAIPTQAKERIQRTIPYTDDEMEERIAAAIEEFDAHPERYDNERPARREQTNPRREPKPRRADQRSSAETANTPDAPDRQQQNDHPNSEQADQKRRRGQRRGGRNRNRDQQVDPRDQPMDPRDQHVEPRQPRDQPTDPREQQQRDAQHSGSKESRQSSEKQDAPQQNQANSERSKRPSRNRNRRPEHAPRENEQSRQPRHDREQGKPKELTSEQSKQPTPQAEAPLPKAKPRAKPSPVKESVPRSETKPQAVKKKTPAKKAVKKATKKAPVKKITTKKVAAKKAVKKAAKKATKKKVAKKAE